TIPLLSAQQNGAVPLKQLWQTTLDENSPPEIIGETGELLFVKTVSGSLFAFNTKEGRLVWKQSGPTPLATPTPSPTPTPITQTLTPGSQSSTAEIQPPPRAPFAVIVSDTVMIGDPAAENMRAFDTKTGQKKWETSLRFEAPNRDAGTRFLPGAVYTDTVVVAVSSKVNPFTTHPTSNPEYLRLVGLDITTGQQKWAFVPDPVKAGAESRQGGVIYGTKTLIVDGPDLSTFGIEPRNGSALWKAFGLFFVSNPEPDTLYALVAQPRGTTSYPVVNKIDPNSGKPFWQKILPIKLSSEQPITFSSDEKTVYISVFASAQKSYLWTLNFDSSEVRQTDTSPYGLYDMSTTNSGILMVQSSVSASGVVYLDLTRNSPSWAIGGRVELLYGLQRPPDKATLYLTFKDETNRGYLFSVNEETGQVITTNQIELPTAPPYFSASQKTIYVVGKGAKPLVYAFARP
ncbi:MAG: PQQ-binding-like beta-propeller repeat protein, partial [Chloroflexota bacterium]